MKNGFDLRLNRSSLFKKYIWILDMDFHGDFRVDYEADGVGFNIALREIHADFGKILLFSPKSGSILVNIKYFFIKSRSTLWKYSYISLKSV